MLRKGAVRCAGLSKSAQCAGAAKGPTFASALVVDGRYLCSRARVRVSLVFWPVDVSARGCGRDV